MITRDADGFLAAARQCAADFGPATARAAFLVSPEGFAHATQSAADNRYMAAPEDFDRNTALRQHRGLQAALSEDVPVVCFPGHAEMPDGVFPNNVFATAARRLVVGRMRHPVRQREAARGDIRAFFADVLGYGTIDLSTQRHPCELTGALVIDRARGLGFCGLSERCDEAGAALMHEALGLRATWMFDLAEGEYHTNVLLAVLAGRAALFCADGFAEPVQAGRVLDALYGPHLVRLSAAEQAAFAGNAIALSERNVWMSRRAADALSGDNRRMLAAAGFAVRGVELDAIEAAGGSLRCCVAEIY
ncbi:arginine deiminase-related protein [Flavobacterium sp. MXW15]|uniref:Arginine deiminase-related protein n=1 Tax=Xanthomonas chitinilytica TaxID=2989819 RepID=A0ABT3JWZ5_9XANT|nr:arginine deiminase-related protein [Xanthomonas sp. H13-6]MCW4455802.1 arginine deiminase-related protein [Flavobacterium sp. MXW15]MCW4473017.1 arginine deiminase-related protein [Xanthomonas sp. H13-6]